MKITKYQHACFTLEKEGKLLVVDPGGWTTDLGAIENVVGVIITHNHPDHFDVSALSALVARSPEVTIYAHESVLAQLDASFTTKAVRVGDVLDVAPFHLTFYGGAHATIHPDIPAIPNLGVLIENTVYYPGDSFALPDEPVKVLALPISAPWLKIAETIEFARQVNAEWAFPTHDAILSDVGRAVADRIIPAQVPNSRYVRLQEPFQV